MFTYWSDRWQQSDKVPLNYLTWAGTFFTLENRTNHIYLVLLQFRLPLHIFNTHKPMVSLKFRISLWLLFWINQPSFTYFSTTARIRFWFVPVTALRDRRLFKSAITFDAVLMVDNYTPQLRRIRTMIGDDWYFFAGVTFDIIFDWLSGTFSVVVDEYIYFTSLNSR